MPYENGPEKPSVNCFRKFKRLQLTFQVVCMWKDHAAPAPIAGWMWLDARCRIVHTQLLSQGQRNALEGSEERGEGGDAWEWTYAVLGGCGELRGCCSARHCACAASIGLRRH